MVAQAASEEKVSMQVYFDVVAKKEGFHFRALDGKTPYAPTDASIQFDFGMPADVERLYSVEANSSGLNVTVEQALTHGGWLLWIHDSSHLKVASWLQIFVGLSFPNCALSFLAPVETNMTIPCRALASEHAGAICDLNLDDFKQQQQNWGSLHLVGVASCSWMDAFNEPVPQLFLRVGVKSEPLDVAVVLHSDHVLPWTSVVCATEASCENIYVTNQTQQPNASLTMTWLSPTCHIISAHWKGGSKDGLSVRSSPGSCEANLGKSAACGGKLTSFSVDVPWEPLPPWKQVDVVYDCGFFLQPTWRYYLVPASW
ncbi:unnamed protein product [Symbiodinium pilosum]|uniref:Uncharacterized protein n=1 Tax=Symbiodinium pilosum TaxID=2952 RepID=A0A812SDR9_SYMPI|nr:unnamed protein product [Symbiodinium pilosum]